MGTEIQKKKHPKQKLSENMKIFIKTQIFSAVIYLIVLLAMGLIAMKLDLPKTKTYYFSACVFAICSFLTGYFSGFLLHKNGLIVGFTHALPVNMIILLISIILSKSNIDFTLPITFVILIISGMLGGIAGVNTRKKNKAVKKKKRGK